MFRNKLLISTFILVLVSPLAMAVTDTNIWVPKRYTVAKHKLLSTAVEAERTDRCVEVVHGQMSVEKSTKQTYYFIITCRDKNRVSYNLAYTYPVKGVEPTLVHEQQVYVPEVEIEIAAEPTITANEVWPLCIEQLQQKTKLMIDVVITSENPEPSDEGVQNLLLEIPFEAKNPQGVLLKYKGVCEIDIDKNIDMKLAPR